MLGYVPINACALHPPCEGRTRAVRCYQDFELIMPVFEACWTENESRHGSVSQPLLDTGGEGVKVSFLICT